MATPLMEEDNAMRYQKTAVVRMGLVKSAEEAWQLFNQNFPHYVKAWKPSGSTLNSSAQTEGNGVEVRAKYERETKTITRIGVHAHVQWNVQFGESSCVLQLSELSTESAIGS